MKLHLIKTTPDVGICAIGPVWSPDGVRFDDFDGPSPFEADHGVVYVDRVMALGDRLVSVDADLVVSETAKTALERLAPSAYLSFLPTTVLSPEGDFLAEYYYALERYEVDALDYDRSEFEYFDTLPDMIESVKTWVFQEARLPAFDIFRSRYWRWVGTEDAVCAIENARLSGFQFELIWQSDGTDGGTDPTPNS